MNLNFDSNSQTNFFDSLLLKVLAISHASKIEDTLFMKIKCINTSTSTEVSDIKHKNKLQFIINNPQNYEDEEHNDNSSIINFSENNKKLFSYIYYSITLNLIDHYISDIKIDDGTKYSVTNYSLFNSDLFISNYDIFEFNIKEMKEVLREIKINNNLGEVGRRITTKIDKNDITFLEITSIYSNSLFKEIRGYVPYIVHSGEDKKYEYVNSVKKLLKVSSNKENKENIDHKKNNNNANVIFKSLINKDFVIYMINILKEVIDSIQTRLILEISNPDNKYNIACLSFILIDSDQKSNSCSSILIDLKYSKLQLVLENQQNKILKFELPINQVHKLLKYLQTIDLEINTKINLLKESKNNKKNKEKDNEVNDHLYSNLDDIVSITFLSDVILNLIIFNSIPALFFKFNYDYACHAKYNNVQSIDERISLYSIEFMALMEYYDEEEYKKEEDKLNYNYDIEQI